MEKILLSSTVNTKRVSEEFNKGVFEIDGLFPGYGITLGNALRRALFSSLPGAAVTYIKVKNAPHEFTTLPGIKEDILEISLNFKKLRFKIHTDEPQILYLRAKGEKEVKASDIEENSLVEIVNKDLHLATLTDKNALLEIEITVEKGMGYLPVEARKKEKLPVGIIALDSFFSPVVKVNFEVENMRVGERTDYNRLRLFIETDGTISPSSALHKVSNILKDHFEKLMTIDVLDFDVDSKKEIKSSSKSDKKENLEEDEKKDKKSKSKK
ncbi:MAG: DNA-directed RNA polymerase subunit alpha [Patescibacteria group bacterium]|nr:DNA-directed RNA polymerase subunit alpha [Patescibacteria group bacterium]MDW8279926.1 DNA-directed RNA polymerase subunit alpha [bacterium]